MAATKAQIRDKVLRKLKVLAFGQTATAEDADIVETAYDEVHALLSEKEVITWGSGDSIPDEAVRPIVKIVAFEVADDFLSSKDEGRYQRLRFEAYGPNYPDMTGGALAILQELAAVDYVPQPTEAEYF